MSFKTLVPVLLETDPARRRGVFGFPWFSGSCAAGMRLTMAALVCGGALTLGACGYRFTTSGQFPSDVQRIFVTIFENKTSQIGVENVLADAVTNEFTTRTNAAAVAGNRRTADAVLSGTITSLQISPISRPAETVTEEARVVITVDARLTSSVGTEIWNAGQVTATETYKVLQNDNQITEFNKNAALERAAVRLAEKLYNRLVDDF